jgi:hypothetical protein
MAVYKDWAVPDAFAGRTPELVSPKEKQHSDSDSLFPCFVSYT